MSPEQERALAMARARQRMAESAPAGGQDKSYTGSILPFSRDAQGNVSFDSNAGLLGSVKRAFMLPGDVMAGEVDPNSPEGRARAMEFAGTFSPMSTAVRAGEAVVPGVANTLRKADVKPPTAVQLSEKAAADYDALRGMNVDYSSQAVQSLARELQSGLEQDGVIAELAPKTFTILGKLQSAPEGSVAPLSGLDAARRTFGRAANDFQNPTEQLAAQRAREGLDQFISEPPPAAVVAGNAEDAARTILEARGNYAAAKRSDRLTGIQEDADLRAAAANSGQNGGNAIRQRIASLIQNPKKAAGYTKEEVDQLRKVVEGSRFANTTRYVGNLLGGGGGLGQMLTSAVGAAGGGAAAGGAGAALGVAIPVAVGTASKRISNALTERALAEADAATRRRSPLYEAMLQQAPVEAQLSPKTEAVIRALILSQQNQNGGGGW